jgi:hypothetical protein
MIMYLAVIIIAPCMAFGVLVGMARFLDWLNDLYLRHGWDPE